MTPTTLRATSLALQRPNNFLLVIQTFDCTKRGMRKADLQVGDRVTVKARVEGFYSGYGGNPAIFLEPGVAAVVGAIDVPSVNRENVSFVCVDFFFPATGRTERAAVDYSNIRKIRT
jgi:hypothetical protein